LTDNESVYRARQNGLLRETARTYRLVDLFAGAGGLTLGFTKSLGQVFEPVWANDFGAFDPALAQKGISGLRHVGKADKAIWEEFYGNWDVLVRESQRIMQRLGTGPQVAAAVDPFRIPDGDIERRGMTKQRVYQDFFRRSVLASYNLLCCVCQRDLQPMLIASPIVPWAVDTKNRLNPENGLCLCLLHDGAFDCGLLTITGTLVARVGRTAKSGNSLFVRQTIVDFDDKPIQRPRRFLPRSEFLDWHCKNVFKPRLCSLRTSAIS
jgi:hypothetical protein